MKITVTTTSTPLMDLLAENDLKLVRKIRTGIKYNFTIQNLGNTNIYIENGKEATTGEGTLIAPNFEANDLIYSSLRSFEIISETSTNTNVRLITT